MTPDEIRKEREELDRQYDRLLPEAIFMFVGSLAALLLIVFVLHIFNLLP